MLIDLVKEKVAGYYGIPIDALHCKTRERPVCHARQVAITISRLFTDFNDVAISKAFDRKRSTVVTSFKNMLSEILVYTSVRDEVLDICCTMGLPGDYVIGFAQFFDARQHTVEFIPKYMIHLAAEYKRQYLKTRKFNTQYNGYKFIAN